VGEVGGFAHSTTLLVQGGVVFSGSPAQLAARAPSDRYLVEIRASGGGGTPPLDAIRRAAGPGTPIAPTHDAGYFLLDCRDPRGLGVVVARLVDGGLDVISARQAQSEIEEAFLVLTGAAA
jgi:hypothetical protein